MQTIVKDDDRVKLVHHTGMTKFQGCQCYKDCTCNEDFISTSYDYYTVHKKFNRPHTTTHSTIEQANKRITTLSTISINYYLKLLAPNNWKGKVIK